MTSKIPSKYRNTTFVLKLAKKSFWIEGWGDRDIDDEMFAKMPIFSYMKKIEQICMRVVHAN